MVSDINPLLLKPRLLEEGNKRWREIKKKKNNSIQEEIQSLLSTPIPLQASFDKSVSAFHPLPFSSFYKYEIFSNTAAQKVAYEKIKNAKAKIIEFESLFNLATDINVRHDLSIQIQEHKEEEDIVKQWDGPGRPSIFAQNPDLLENIHNCVEFVSRSEKSDHPDSHYCLALVKGAQTFALSFSDYSVIISQDDKAKVPLGIPAVGRTFKSIETVNKPVSIPDYDFPLGSKMKFIPSAYLLINPKDTNNNLRSGYLSIYVRPEYFVGTTAATHMIDLISIVNSREYDKFINIEGKVRPLWILIVDGRPDENPKFLKNIIKYSKFFCSIDLDYLSVHTHAPEQSSFNPVERSMASLSSKLAGIMLPIDHFSTHLNSQGKVIDEELAMKNFRFSGEKLCDIWRRDKIHEKPVQVEYLDTHDNLLADMEISWQWIEEHSPEATILLQEYNGFLPPYSDKLKIPLYDKHCPSISSEMYQCLCCSECEKYFPTLKFIQKHKLQYSNRRYQDSNPDPSKNTLSNSATYEDFVRSQELCEEIVFERGLSDSEAL
ncbi:30566_t:CDS:2 [Gigaspora margarita]|uniref:30566_t:CDS:1 n=1 Tax=Gigaspora margarita TaxID=4874 RepID=A0ABN7VJT9_GIGMA|nr:30566_t:CDS:2 [Gigaspora margarita]